MSRAAVWCLAVLVAVSGASGAVSHGNASAVPVDIGTAEVLRLHPEVDDIICQTDTLVVLASHDAIDPRLCDMIRSGATFQDW